MAVACGDAVAPASKDADALTLQVLPICADAGLKRIVTQLSVADAAMVSVVADCKLSADEYVDVLAEIDATALAVLAKDDVVPDDTINAATTPRDALTEHAVAALDCAAAEASFNTSAADDAEDVLDVFAATTAVVSAFTTTLADAVTAPPQTTVAAA